MRSEEETIMKETEAFLQSWNAADAGRLASFHTEDSVRVGAFGDVQHGRAEIAAAYDRLLHETMPGARLTQQGEAVRMLSPEIAVWQAAIEIARPGHGDAAPLRGHVVQVMKKVGGRWLILEAHPKIFPSPPAQR